MEFQVPVILGSGSSSSGKEPQFQDWEVLPVTIPDSSCGPGYPSLVWGDGSAGVAQGGGAALLWLLLSFSGWLLIVAEAPASRLQGLPEGGSGPDLPACLPAYRAVGCHALLSWTGVSVI